MAGEGVVDAPGGLERGIEGVIAAPGTPNASVTPSRLRISTAARAAVIRAIEYSCFDCFYCFGCRMRTPVAPRGEHFRIMELVFYYLEVM